MDEMRRVEVNCGEGRHSLSLFLYGAGCGWSAVLTGGEKPHVGGVVLAVPRESLKGTGEASCDVYSVPVPGHCDNVLGERIARELCKATSEVVSLSSGVHIDEATADDLDVIEANSKLLCQMAVLELIGE